MSLSSAAITGLSELIEDPPGDRIRRVAGGDADSCLRNLRIGKLTGKQGGIHEGVLSPADAISEKIGRHIEPNEAHGAGWDAPGQFQSIGMLESRTGEDPVCAAPIPGEKYIVELVQPGSSIFIGKRNSLAHLLFVRGGVEVVRVDEWPTRLTRQGMPDGRLP